MYEKHGEIMNLVFSYVLFYIFYCCLAFQSAQLLSNLRTEIRYLLRNKYRIAFQINAHTHVDVLLCDGAQG